MNLQRVWIDRYGPLQAELLFDGDVHVVRGPNESGKTLLVEALLKVLLGEDAVQDVRVDERPEGFVVLDDGTDEHKLEPGESLVDYYEEAYSHEITASELRNVFVVRDADLRIDNEDQFYERVTDRITGIRTRDIRRIKEELRAEGRLMDKRDEISAADEYDDAGEQVDAARTLRNEITSYLDGADDIAELEGRLLEARLAKRRLEDDKRELERARERDDYRELVAETEAMTEALVDLDDLPDASVVGDLDHQLEQFTEGDRDELVDRKERYTTVAKWAAAVTAITFAGVLAAGAPLPTVVVPILSIALAGYAAFQVGRASRTLASLETERESILTEARRVGIVADDLGELRAETEAIQERRSELNGAINEAKGVLRNRLDVPATDPEVVVQQADEQLAERRQRVDTDVERPYSRSELDDVTDELRETRGTIEELEGALEDHRRQLREFSERAYQLDYRTFTGDPLELEIANLDALEQLVDRLDEFVKRIETDADLSLTAYRIFERIEEAEEEKVTELFGEGSTATELFEEVTDDRYERVRYDHEANQLLVERANERTFTPAELSKATRDQLYLCIRVALAQELPNVDTGFFVMDDAFLAADPDRLERQADLVDRLADDGWQVIYLTAKQDAVDALTPRADGTHELDPLP